MPPSSSSYARYMLTNKVLPPSGGINWALRIVALAGHSRKAKSECQYEPPSAMPAGTPFFTSLDSTNISGYSGWLYWASTWISSSPRRRLKRSWPSGDRRWFLKTSSWWRRNSWFTSSNAVSSRVSRSTPCTAAPISGLKGIAFMIRLLPRFREGDARGPRYAPAALRHALRSTPGIPTACRPRPGGTGACPAPPPCPG